MAGKPGTASSSSRPMPSSYFGKGAPQRRPERRPAGAGRPDDNALRAGDWKADASPPSTPWARSAGRPDLGLLEEPERPALAGHLSMPRKGGRSPPAAGGHGGRQLASTRQLALEEIGQRICRCRPRRTVDGAGKSGGAQRARPLKPPSLLCGGMGRYAPSERAQSELFRSLHQPGGMEDRELYTRRPITACRRQVWGSLHPTPASARRSLHELEAALSHAYHDTGAGQVAPLSRLWTRPMSAA